MDALFEDLVDRLRTSGRLADSTLLEIVHSAMLDAHKKTVSEEKRGLVRLHHNARFHELSIMELECCLKVVRKEAENNFSDQRYEFEQALASISEQQALMQKKLEELEIIIAEKDRDLTRIKENELKLAFDVISNEVDKAAKENVKNNSTNQSTVPNVDRESNGMFDELKSSIEQKVSKIEVKLKNERHILTDKFNKLKQDGVTDLENDGAKQFHGLYNIAHLLIGFEEMISDVSMLEENIKFSFKMIERSTNLFKTKLEESKLEMDMEREMLNLLMKSYIQEAQCNNCKLDSIGVITAAKTTKLQSTKETLEEAAALREEIDKVVVSSMINEWNNKKNIVDIKHSLEEEIDNVLFGEIMKDLTKFCSSSSTLALSKERDHKAAISLMINDCNANKEAIRIEYSLREDIDRFVISETMKDFLKCSSSTSAACHNNENSDDEVQKETIDKEVLRDTNMAFTKLSERFSDVETMISSRTDANNKRLVDYGFTQCNCFYNQG
ncbi:hypothetical protein FCM35_KLT13414 [Carex littledalei]|uniref:Uncharacterized protein n=1 Tax=Carex littledalei TaxID=544730 RepID=A0A833VGD1_9POAL|nr:hypothetical protein FCM35_KLT13414 [Carex littledalei]